MGIQSDKFSRGSYASPKSYIAIFVPLFLIGWILRRHFNRKYRLNMLGGDAVNATRLPLGLDMAFGLAKSWYFDELVPYALKYTQNLGHTLNIDILGMHLIYTDDPENIEAIMSTQFNDYGKGKDLYRTWKSLMGDSIFATEGSTWEKSKSMMHPHLTKARTGDLDYSEKHIQRLLRRISAESHTSDMTDLLTRFSLDLVTDVFLGDSADSLEVRDFPVGTAMDQLQAFNTIRTIFKYWGSLVPDIFVRRHMLELNRYLDQKVENILDQSEKTTSSKGSWQLTDSLRANCRTNKEIKDQVVALLIAGRDPLGLSLVWALYELSRNPKIVRKLRAEIMASVGPSERPTSEMLQSMTYLQNIVREVLRLYPPLGFNVRIANENTSLPRGGGPDGSEKVGILKGTQLIYSVICLQRRTDIFGADATTFRPERWKTWSPSKWEYAPFNHGPRVCLGKSFATTHMRYALCRIFQEYETLSPAMEELKPKGLKLELNIKPASPVICKFQPSHSRKECVDERHRGAQIAESELLL